ncbi:FAD-binding domain-containing protein [Hysterangium stoloniferum]|nr:FAD-binding domain-containing protein [Hysterangium stoloniferum]
MFSIALLILQLLVTFTRASQFAFYEDEFVQTPLSIKSDPPILTVTPLQWAKLNETIHGRLHPNVPFARDCFKPNVDPEDVADNLKCKLVTDKYKDEQFRTAHPSGQINTQWETCQADGFKGCLLDYYNPTNTDATTLPRTCKMGSVSPFYIDVATPEDVQAAFIFSRVTAVPLVIKNTGHDYKGKSTAPHSLELWTHNLNDTTYHPSFKPTCPSPNSHINPVSAVTLGAGVQWFKAYAFAETHNITLVGGADRTVGAVGGWLQGGGHGALTNTMGMGADRVLEFSIVTPDGEIRIANQCQNQDLFFALRGGGGGTFGVVLSATILASPPVTIQAVLVQFPLGMPAPQGFIEKYTPDFNASITDSADPFALTQSLWAVLLHHAKPWAEQGWGGYVTANSALYINPVLDKDEAEKSTESLVSWAKELAKLAPSGEKAKVLTIQGEYDSWGHFFNTFADGNSADLGQPLAITSRLVPTTSVETPEARNNLLAALLHAERLAPGVRFLVTTPYNFPSNPDTLHGPSTHPAWRKSIFHVTTVTTWNYNTTVDAIKSKYADAKTAMEYVRELSDAAYVNESDVYEEDWEKVFWGSNYERLLEVKHKYDPHQLLDCWQCVGWAPESPRFSCYIDS